MVAASVLARRLTERWTDEARRGRITTPATLAAVAACGVLTLAPSASVAAPWSAPVDVLSSRLALRAPAVAFDHVGRASIVINQNGPPNGDVAARFVRTRDGRIVALPSLPGRVVGAPAPFGKDSVAMLRTSSTADASGGTGSRVRVGVSFGRTARPFGRMTALDTFSSQFSDGGGPSIAANDAGLVAVAYIERRAARDYVLRLALRRPGGHFGAPRVVRAGKELSDARVAVGDDGDLLLAYHSANSIEARVQRAGRKMSPVQRIGRTSGHFASIAATASARGLMVVAWRGNGSATVRAAIRAAGAHRFGPAVVLDGGSGSVSTDAIVHAAMDPAGATTVAWSDPRSVVRTATTTARAGFAAAGDVPGATGDTTGVSVDARGTVVSWIGQLGTSKVVAAATRPAGGAFSQPELVSGLEPAIDGAAIAIDPLTATRLELWSSRSLSAGPLAPSVSSVRAAARPG
jgi:hypothetical protein